MTPHNKLRCANALMLIGVAPLSLALCAIVGGLVYYSAVQGKLAGGEGIVTVIALVVTYPIALTVGVPAALWSSSVGQRHADIAAPAARKIRIYVGIVLAAPFLLYQAMLLVTTVV